MEKYAASDTVLKIQYAACLFADPNSRQARVERIDHLNTLEWQIKYLTLFCALVNKRFESVLFNSEEEKLRFYASAYNSGFHKTETQIRETEQKALFPHFSRKKFKYSDIAVWFYREILR